MGALIDNYNAAQALKPPWLRSVTYHKDQLTVDRLKRSGLTLDDVPSVGERVDLREIESTQWGGIDEDVTHRVHPENLRVALAAAQLLGLEVAGVDIISSDISVPWYENGAIINEVNFAPLLGGGEISRAAIPEYLSRLVEGDGRIPVALFVGDRAAMEAARELHKEWCKGGRCFLTSAEVTVSPSSDPVVMPFSSLYRRARALLLNSQVESIILVLQDTELLETGFPVDRISEYHIANSHLHQRGNSEVAADTEEVAALIQHITELARGE